MAVFRAYNLLFLFRWTKFKPQNKFWACQRRFSLAMARNKPTNQHYVPQCYLREWADTRHSNKGEPVIWIFDRDGKNKRKDKVRNVLVSYDLYTLRIKGQKNFVIEETFASLEGKYAQVFRDKINRKLPLSAEEHIVLCAFGLIGA
jgi:Protein of unknown function (DUF4238)